MNPFLVTATDRNGRRDSFVRDAESLEHLRNMLEREGYVEIEFLDDEYSARLRAERPAEGRDDSREGARLEARLRTGAAPVATWLLAVRRSWQFLSINVAVLAYGLWRGYYVAAAIAAALLVGWALLLRTGLRRGDRYDALVRAQAAGDHEVAAELIEALAADPKTAGISQLQFDLAFRKACLRARRGELDGALASVEALRSTPDAAGGVFETRCASIHYQAEDMPGFIRGMEAGYAASGEAAPNRLDLAFAHARVGDADRARELLAGVDRRNLPAMHAPIVQASEAMLELRAGELAGATSKLETAVEDFGRYAGNAAVWPIHGILVGWLARALAASGRREEAVQVLEPWRAVALSCLDADLRRTLQAELEA